MEAKIPVGLVREVHVPEHRVQAVMRLLGLDRIQARNHVLGAMLLEAAVKEAASPVAVGRVCKM